MRDIIAGGKGTLDSHGRQRPAQSFVAPKNVTSLIKPTQPPMSPKGRKSLMINDSNNSNNNNNNHQNINDSNKNNNKIGDEFADWDPFSDEQSQSQPQTQIQSLNKQ